MVARVASLAPGQEAPLRAALEELQASGRPVEAQARALWAFLTRRVLRPEHDVAAQRAVLEPVCRVAASASAAAPGQGGSITVPLWFPDEQLVASTNLARFMTKFGGSGGSSSSRLWAQRRYGAQLLGGGAGLSAPSLLPSFFLCA